MLQLHMHIWKLARNICYTNVLALSTTDSVAPNSHLEVSHLNIWCTNARRHGGKLSGQYLCLDAYTHSVTHTYLDEHVPQNIDIF